MLRYRIRQLRNGKFIAQIRFLFWWEDLFCGAVSDLPDQFDTAEECERKICETHQSRIAHRECVVKEFTL